MNDIIFFFLRFSFREKFSVFKIIWLKLSVKNLVKINYYFWKIIISGNNSISNFSVKIQIKVDNSSYFPGGISQHGTN